MKNLLSVGLLSLAGAAAILGACASAPTDSAIGTSSAASTQPAPTARLAGTWAFVLAASDVAQPIRERCTKDSAGDVAKANACWADIATHAALEKIRFTTDAAGHTVWTSFGDEGTKEILFVEVPVELAADGPGHVLAKVSGKPKGEQAEQFARASVNAMRIEVVDAHTIAMTDPKKGRLVFTKE